MKSRINDPLYAAFAWAFLLLSGCSDAQENMEEAQIAPTTPLQVNVLKTATTGARSVISAATDLDKIAVYAQSTTNNTSAAGNNRAIYVRTPAGSTGAYTWEMESSPRILLSAEIADVYAYYPSTLTLSDADAQSGSTLPLSLLTAETAIELPSGGFTGGKTYTASAETDYLWATPVRASNGKAANPKGTTYQINLTMNHALAQICFRIYKDATYTNAGVLTKIQVKNLKTGDALKMNISNGNITMGKETTTTFTRTPGNSGYTLTTLGPSPDPSALDNLPAFGILVLPDATTNKSGMSACFIIDGKEYAVAFSGTEKKWEAGKNYRYTICLSGTAATLTGIHVQPWNYNGAGQENDIY